MRKFGIFSVLDLLNYEKASFRVRAHGFRAGRKELFVSNGKVAVRLFDLSKNSSLQLDLFGEKIKKESMEQIVYKINQKWGDFVVSSARSLEASDLILDRIAFGGVSDL